MTRISDIIDDEVEPPAIHFNGRKDYTYGSPSDSGTGTSYKNLIILDLAFLNLTSLPAIAHDSSLFKQELGEKAGISAASIAKLGRDGNVTTDILVKICVALECEVSDILEIVSDEEEKKK